jgi:hypothetical protein
MSDPRFTPEEAQAVEDGCRAVFEAADRARLRWRLDAALAEVEREAGATLAEPDAMATVLRKWCLGSYPTLPSRPCDTEGLAAMRKVLGAYQSMEARTSPGGPLPDASAKARSRLEERIAQVRRLRSALREQQRAGDAPAVERSLTLLRHAYRQTRELCTKHGIALPHDLGEE